MAAARSRQFNYAIARPQSGRREFFALVVPNFEDRPGRDAAAQCGPNCAGAQHRRRGLAHNVLMDTAPRRLTIDDVRAAAERVRDDVLETPCLASRTLSHICGCQVFLKFENLQFTASFKERGALNKMAQL